MVFSLHVMHQSLQADDDNTDTAQEIRYALREVTPDVISWTETAGLKNEIRGLCRDLSYQPVFFPNNDGEAFAFNPEVLKLKAFDNIVATNPPGEARRFINWVKLKLDDEVIWYHTAHWYSLQSDTGTVKRHNQMTRQMAAQVRKHAQGKQRSFFSGDIAISEDSDVGNYNQIMRENDLLTVWDEMSVYPATLDQGKRTVDIIGSYDRDKKTKATRYKLHPLKSSNHRALSVWYDLVEVPAGTNPDGTDPQIPDYNTGGQVSWQDYLNNDIYNLPQAVDDSVDPAHGGLIT